MKEYQVMVTYTYTAFVSAENENEVELLAIDEAMEMMSYNTHLFEITDIICLEDEN